MEAEIRPCPPRPRRRCLLQWGRFSMEAEIDRGVARSKKMIKRFKKLVEREGILLEVKKRRYYAKPSSEKHERTKKMERKKRKKVMRGKKLY